MWKSYVHTRSVAESPKTCICSTGKCREQIAGTEEVSRQKTYISGVVMYISEVVTPQERHGEAKMALAFFSRLVMLCYAMTCYAMLCYAM